MTKSIVSRKWQDNSKRLKCRVQGAHGRAVARAQHSSPTNWRAGVSRAWLQFILASRPFLWVLSLPYFCLVAPSHTHFCIDYFPINISQCPRFTWHSTCSWCCQGHKHSWQRSVTTSGKSRGIILVQPSKLFLGAILAFSPSCSESDKGDKEIHRCHIVGWVNGRKRPGSRLHSREVSCHPGANRASGLSPEGWLSPGWWNKKGQYH